MMKTGRPRKSLSTTTVTIFGLEPEVGGEVADLAADGEAIGVGGFLDAESSVWVSVRLRLLGDWGWGMGVGGETSCVGSGVGVGGSSVAAGLAHAAATSMTRARAKTGICNSLL